MNTEERTHLGRSAPNLAITDRGVVLARHCAHTGPRTAMADAGWIDEAPWQLLRLGATRKPCPLPVEIRLRSPPEGATASLRAPEFGLPGQ
jgi:hypothetical protein